MCWGEFEQLLIAGKYVSQGGIDFARGALEKALGPRKAQCLLDRVTSTTTSGFYMLRNVDPNQIIPFISKEHPQTIALILSQLDSNQAAGVLNGLQEGMQADVSYRIAMMDNISPQVLRDLEESLSQDLQAILAGPGDRDRGPESARRDPESHRKIDGAGSTRTAGWPRSGTGGGCPKPDVRLRRHRGHDRPGDPDDPQGGGHQGPVDRDERARS